MSPHLLPLFLPLIALQPLSHHFTFSLALHHHRNDIFCIHIPTHFSPHSFSFITPFLAFKDDDSAETSILEYPQLSYLPFPVVVCPEGSVSRQELHQPVDGISQFTLHQASLHWFITLYFFTVFNVLVIHLCSFKTPQEYWYQVRYHMQSFVHRSSICDCYCHNHLPRHPKKEIPI